MPKRIAFMPVNTYPEAAPDAAVLATIGFASSLGCALHVSTMSVEVPKTVSPIGGLLINVEAMAQAAEDRSMAECARLQALIKGASRPDLDLSLTTHRVVLGAAPDTAAIEARLFDLALLPWSAETVSAQDTAQAVVFGAGVPTIIVPESARTATIDRIAIAWDGSRVAARALCDVLPLLQDGGRISVVTVEGEKKLARSATAQTLAASLHRRGYNASAVTIAHGGKPIAEALQAAALSEGAQLMAMGGFGHSRLRDFILGGATMGVFSDLRMAVLLSH
jgi:nucleotide-binding universal stress UspA family protein